MVKINWCMLFEKKSLTILKIVAYFQQVSNDLPFMELRGTGEELQLKICGRSSIWKHQAVQLLYGMRFGWE